MSISEELAGLIRVLRGAVTSSKERKTIDQLETKIAELQAQLDAARPVGERCPYCGAMSLMLSDQTIAQGPFGALGCYDYFWRCSSCGRQHMSNGTEPKP